NPSSLSVWARIARTARESSTTNALPIISPDLYFEYAMPGGNHNQPSHCPIPVQSESELCYDRLQTGRHEAQFLRRFLSIVCDLRRILGRYCHAPDVFGDIVDSLCRFHHATAVLIGGYRLFFHGCGNAVRHVVDLV